MTAACGINCDVCGLKPICGGCLPGTDPRAPERLEKVKQMVGMSCPVLECAIKNKVAYCLSCDKFPCEVHYRGMPYSKNLLDIFKKFKERK
jgi:hypothetical protein